MTQPHLSVVLALAAASCGSATQPAAPPNDATTSARVVIYDHESSDVVHLYNLDDNVVEMRSKTRMDAATEFASPLLSCSTELIHCQRSGLVVAIPRRRPFPREWGNAEISCRRRSGDSGEGRAELSGRCDFAGGQATLFDYSPERGILRYRGICPQCDDGWFRLRGEEGLFAAEH